MSYVYVRSEANLWTVGFHRPDGRWEAESDHGTAEEAAQRVAWLNGGGDNELRAAREVVRQTRGYLAMFNGTPELRNAVAAYEQVATA